MGRNHDEEEGHAHNVARGKSVDDLNREIGKLERKLSKPNFEGSKRFGFGSVDQALSHGLAGLMETVIDGMPRQPCYEIRMKNFSYHTRLADRGSKERDVDKLKNINCVLRPGTLTLVLGGPGSGKTSFMKAIAGRLNDPKARTSGSLRYNKTRCEDLNLAKIVGYVDQNDMHLPTLTVRETFDFAKHACMVNPARFELPDDSLPPEDLEEVYKLKTDLIIHLLGLTRAADTQIGNALLRGVSGGERKRVTIGEVIMSENRVLLADEISTGLDSAATYDIVKTLKTYAGIAESTVVISLLQPSPEVFELFDDVIVLNDGRMVFNGRREEVLPYFSSIGFHCPKHKDVADFLQEVTSPELNEAYAGKNKRLVTPEDFASAFENSEYFDEIKEDLKAGYDGRWDVAEVSELSHAQYEANFANSWFGSFALCLSRQRKLVTRDVAFLRARIAQCIVMGIITGFLFYDMAKDAFQLRYGLAFFATLFMAMGQMAALESILTQRNVFYKQRDANFFPTSAYTLSTLIVQFPISVVETLLFSTVVYWLTNLTDSDNGEHYGVFVIILFLVNLSMGQFFRVLGAVMPDASKAQAIGGSILLFMMLFSGYLIAKSEIPDGWIWAYWLSPFSYAFLAIMQNEFLSGDSAYEACPGGAPTCTTTVGEVYLEVMGMPTDPVHISIGIVVLIAFLLFFLIVQAIGLGFFRKTSVSSNPPSDSESGKKPKSKGHKQLDFKEITLSFHNLSYSVPAPDSKERRIELLHDVSGFCKPGTLTALMGSSGAGKTTLLDVIAGRKTGGDVDGEILLNGYPKDDKTFSRIAGYVEQMDIHSPSMTVREALRFSARLRLPRSMTDDEREEHVNYVLATLELQRLADIPIGQKESGGLSTEQAKRVTIGVELVANTSVLFLDEPTSGLDSSAASVVMRVIKNIAVSGRTVICTIHQPSSELFYLFDNLLLLKRGGEVVYFGELGNYSKKMVQYFQGVRGTRKIAPHANPATYMLECIGAGVGNTVDVDFSAAYRSSDLFLDNQDILKELETPKKGQKLPKFDSVYAAPTHVQMRECLKKVCRQYWRTPSYNLTRTAVIIFIGLLFGSVYYDIGNFPNTDIFVAQSEVGQSQIFSGIAVVFITTVFLGVINQNSVLPVLTTERAVYYRERAAKMYSPFVYNAAQGIIEIPYLLFNSFVFMVIFYYLTGFDAENQRFMSYWFAFTLYFGMSTYLGQFLAVWAPNAQVAGIIGPALISLWNLFCGFMVPEPDIPVFFIWLYWISPLRYALEALVTTLYECRNTCELLAGSNPPKTVEQHIIDTFGMDPSHYWFNVLALIFFIVFFRFGTYVGLRNVMHINR